MEQNSWEEKISKLEVENQQLKKKVRALKDECFALEEQLEDERDEGASAEELQVLKSGVRSESRRSPQSAESARGLSSAG